MRIEILENEHGECEVKLEEGNLQKYLLALGNAIEGICEKEDLPLDVILVMLFGK